MEFDCPNKYCLQNLANAEHGRSKISSPRVALTAILSLAPPAPKDPEEEFITADSYSFLAGQTNLLAPLANDPTLHDTPVLPLSRIISSAPLQTAQTKPGRRICRHIFPCGSPLDIRMRYNPLEPADSGTSTEIVLLSVDLSVTPHTGGSVLVKEVNVDVEGGTIVPLQQIGEKVLKRYDVMTLLFRYERYGGDAGRKMVSTSATMAPLLSESEETSPKISSLWNKILDIPSLNPKLAVAGSQRAVSMIMSPATGARHSPKPSLSGKRGVHARGQTLTEVPTRPISTLSAGESPNLSITVQIPSSGVNPGEEFTVDIQVVNRATRPIKLALHVDSGQAHFRTQSRGPNRSDKLLPRVPLSSTLPTPTSPQKTLMTDIEARAFYLRQKETRQGKGIIALGVEGKIG
jgi:hypothetical protein